MTDNLRGGLPDDLILRFRAGDREACKEVYMSCYPVILLFVRTIIRDEAEAKDIVSDAIVKMWKKKDQFESLGHIRAFLYLVTKHAAIDRQRSSRRHARSHEEIRYLSREEGERIDRKMIEMEVFRELRSQVDALSPRCRQVFKLMYFDQLGASEIASRLGISPATVQVHRTRALKSLRSGPLGKYFQ